MAWAVMKQDSWDREEFGYAERGGPDGDPVAHRTKAGAAKALASLVPAGKDPFVYAGLEVHEVHDIDMLLIVD